MESESHQIFAGPYVPYTLSSLTADIASLYDVVPLYEELCGLRRQLDVIARNDRKEAEKRLLTTEVKIVIDSLQLSHLYEQGFAIPHDLFTALRTFCLYALSDRTVTCYVRDQENQKKGMPSGDLLTPHMGCKFENSMYRVDFAENPQFLEKLDPGLRKDGGYHVQNTMRIKSNCFSLVSNPWIALFYGINGPITHTKYEGRKLALYGFTEIKGEPLVVDGDVNSIARAERIGEKVYLKQKTSAKWFKVWTNYSKDFFETFCSWILALSRGEHLFTYRSEDNRGDRTKINLKIMPKMRDINRKMAAKHKVSLLPSKYAGSPSVEENNRSSVLGKQMHDIRIKIYKLEAEKKVGGPLGAFGVNQQIEVFQKQHDLIAKEIRAIQLQYKEAIVPAGQSTQPELGRQPGHKRKFDETESDTCMTPRIPDSTDFGKEEIEHP